MSRQRKLPAIAIGALSIGVLVYVFDRQPEFIDFIPRWLSFNNHINNLFGSLGNCLPTFLRVYAYILLTLAIAASSITKVLLICLVWFSLYTLFELAQFDPIEQKVAMPVPSWFDGVPFMENNARYSQHGNFDVVGLLSIAAGTIAAYFNVTVLTWRVSQ